MKLGRAPTIFIIFMLYEASGMMNAGSTVKLLPSVHYSMFVSIIKFQNTGYSISH